jgi:hypothetical protein
VAGALSEEVALVHKSVQLGGLPALGRQEQLERPDAVSHDGRMPFASRQLLDEVLA